MPIKQAISTIFLSLLITASYAVDGGGEARQQYITKWKDVAMQQMTIHGIPASITLAQGILESRNGQSTLTVKSNNHFGIKCHDWKGKKVYADDDKKNECFRKYKSAGQSFEDHSQFLLRKRYADLFKLKPDNYKGWAKGLKKAGYATDPSYAKLLIKIIEQHELYKYDKLVLKGNFEYSPPDEIIAVNEKKKKDKRNDKMASSSSRVIDLTSSYNIKKHKNRIKYVLAKKGDSIEGIAESLDLGYWQLARYNDLGKRKQLKEGEVIFIQPKRNSSKTKTHKVVDGETLLSISQLYGVKMKKLEKYNGIRKSEKLAVGKVILLKKVKS